MMKNKTTQEATMSAKYTDSIPLHLRQAGRGRTAEDQRERLGMAVACLNLISEDWDEEQCKFYPTELGMSFDELICQINAIEFSDDATWEVQTYTIFDGWVNCWKIDDGPWIFTSESAAIDEMNQETNRDSDLILRVQKIEEATTQGFSK
jgi:hypothetical protein